MHVSAQVYVCLYVSLDAFIPVQTFSMLRRRINGKHKPSKQGSQASCPHTSQQALRVFFPSTSSLQQIPAIRSATRSLPDPCHQIPFRSLLGLGKLQGDSDSPRRGHPAQLCLGAQATALLWPVTLKGGSCLTLGGGGGPGGSLPSCSAAASWRRPWAGRRWVRPICFVTFLNTEHSWWQPPPVPLGWQGLRWARAGRQWDPPAPVHVRTCPRWAWCPGWGWVAGPGRDIRERKPRPGDAQLPPGQL